MPKRRIDILKKHQNAIDDLVQIGVIDPKVLTQIDVYRARRINGMTEKQTAQTFKRSQVTVRRYIRFLETKL